MNLLPLELWPYLKTIKSSNQATHMQVNIQSKRSCVVSDACLDFDVISNGWKSFNVKFTAKIDFTIARVSMLPLLMLCHRKFKG